MAQSEEPLSKAKLRATLLANRGALHTAAADSQLSKRVNDFVQARAPKTVATYLSFANEPSTYLIIAELIKSSVRVLLPAVSGGHSMRWYEFDGESITKGALGFAEPDAAKLPEADLSAAEILFLPALAIDLHGARLGRGGGYFDRALAGDWPNEAQVKVALVYYEEVLAQLPSEPHDVPVDFVITDKRLIEF